MIKVNLARKRKSSSAGGFDLSSLLERFKGAAGGTGADGEQKKFDINSPIVKTMLAIGAVLLLDDTLGDFRKTELAKVDKEIQKIEKDKNDIQARLNKIKGFEPIKRQLEEDEKQIKIKLEVVNRLLENRNEPSKIMMQVAQSIPEELWLTELKLSEKAIVLNGSTPGYSQVSDFIKALNETTHFGEIALKGIQEGGNLTKGESYQNFELTAARRSYDGTSK